MDQNFNSVVIWQKVICLSYKFEHCNKAERQFFLSAGTIDLSKKAIKIIIFAWIGRMR